MLRAALLALFGLAAASRAEPPAPDPTAQSLGDALLAPETSAAVDTVIRLFRRTPPHAADVAEIGQLLDSTPEIVGSALDDARHTASDAKATALRAHATRLREALRSLDLGGAHAPGLAIERVTALTGELDAAAGERGRARRSERLAALLARMRDGEWRRAPEVDTDVKPSSRWFTGTPDAGVAR